MELSDHDRLALAVACKATESKTQEVIKYELGLPNQAAVARLLDRARNNGWLAPEQVVFPASLTLQEIDDIKNRGFAERDILRRQLERLARTRKGVALTRLHIIHTHGVPSQQYEQFSSASAGHVAELIDFAETCAVAWGRTVHRVIDRLRPVRTRPNICFVPTAGDPMNDHDLESSPSTAAQRLAEKYGSSSLSLRGVPARIPAKLARHSAVLRDFVGHSINYDRIFNTSRPSRAIMEKVDLIITGVGDAKFSENDAWFTAIRLLEGDRVAKKLQEISAGSIGGVWIANVQTSRQNKIVRDVNGRWLGIQERHIRSCATRSIEASPTLGVVVLAVEPEKVSIVRQTIGMVNHLLISEALAKKLVDTGGS